VSHDDVIRGPLSEDDVMLFLAHQHPGKAAEEIAAFAGAWSTTAYYLLRRPGVSFRLLALRFGSFDALQNIAADILYANSMMRPCSLEIPPGRGISTCTVTPVGEQHLRARGLLA
jgi:hypothetical protein